MKKRLTLAASGGVTACGAAAVPFSALRYLGLALLCIGLCIAFFVLVKVRRVKIAAAIVIAVGLALFLAAEIPVLAGAHSDADTAADYLVAAGAGVDGTTPSRAMLNRLQAALSWLDENPQGVVIVSGSQGDCGELISEAQAMENWLLEQGVAPDRIIKDEQAGSTAENIRGAMEIIRQRGGDETGKIAFASSEYHLYRIRAMARRLGCSPVCVAGHTTNGLNFLNYAIREALAVWKLWIFGI